MYEKLKQLLEALNITINEDNINLILSFKEEWEKQNEIEISLIDKLAYNRGYDDGFSFGNECGERDGYAKGYLNAK